MAGTVDPQVGDKQLKAAGRMAVNPLETQVGGAIVDLLSLGADKPTSYTRPIKLSDTTGSILAKIPLVPVVKVSNGQFVNDEGTLEMEDGYNLSGTANAMATLAPFVLAKFGLPRVGAAVPRVVFAAKEWSAFEDKFVDQLFNNPNNPEQGREIAAAYMIGLRSGNIDVRKQEDQLTRKYFGELTKPFPGGAAAGAVENVTAFGTQAASTTRAPEQSDEDITKAIVMATSGKDKGLAGDTKLRSFLLQQGMREDALKEMDTNQVYEMVSSMPQARKAAREAAANLFEGYNESQIKSRIKVAQRNAASVTYEPESIAIMRYVLSTPMPGNDYARLTPGEVDSMSAFEIRKELMK